jgi:hypothetical protein
MQSFSFPCISVFLPIQNPAALLGEAIFSMQFQSVAEWEAKLQEVAGQRD